MAATAHADPSVALSIETTVSGSCINGVLGPLNVRFTPQAGVLSARIVNGNDADNPPTDTMVDFGNVIGDGNGNALLVNGSQSILIGQFDRFRLQNECADGGNVEDNSVFEPTSIIPAAGVKISVSRSVASCSSFDGIWPVPPYRKVDYTLTIQAGAQTLTLRPTAYSHPDPTSNELLFNNSSDCKNWKSSWNQADKIFLIGH